MKRTAKPVLANSVPKARTIIIKRLGLYIKPRRDYSDVRSSNYEEPNPSHAFVGGQCDVNSSGIIYMQPREKAYRAAGNSKSAT